MRQRCIELLADVDRIVGRSVIDDDQFPPTLFASEFLGLE